MSEPPERYKPVLSLDGLEVRRRQFKYFLEKHTLRGCVETALMGGEGAWDRLYGILGTGLSLVRGAREQTLLSLHREEDFSVPPLDPNEYRIVHEKLDSGYWSDVYLAEPLKAGLPRRVVKFEFPAVQHPPDQLFEELGWLKSEHEFLKREFAAEGLPDLIPQTEYLLATNPTTRKLGVTRIQIYAGDGRIDLMDEKNEEHVRELLKAHGQLRGELEKFKRVVSQLRDSEEYKMREPDLIVRSVFIVEEGGHYVLRLVDPHRVHPNNHIAQPKQAKKIKYLRSL